MPPSFSLVYAAETALHLAAKAALARRREIVLPAACLGPGYGAGPSHARARRHAIEHVRTEVHLGDIVPDLIAWIGPGAAGRDLYVEIRVTHAVNETKAAKLRTRGVSTVEIDLNHAARDLSPAVVERFVVDDVANKRWVVNTSADNACRVALTRSRLIPTEAGAGRPRVTYCPVHARRWIRKAHADVADDCASCEQCLAIAPADAHVRCIGHLASPAVPTRHQLGGLLGSGSPGYSGDFVAEISPKLLGIGTSKRLLAFEKPAHGRVWHPDQPGDQCLFIP